MQKKIKFNSVIYGQQNSCYDKRHVTNDILQIKVLNNTLLWPQNRAIRKPLNSWVEELRSRIQAAHYQRELMSSNQIADIFNESINIFMELNYVKYAREICYSQIHMFIEWSDRINDPQLLMYVLQPWINLIRLDRIEGSGNDALNKLNALSKINQSQSKEHMKCASQRLLLLDIFNQHDELHEHIMMQSLFERIQLYLDAYHYTELIQFIDTQQDTIYSQRILLQEAKAIALMNTGQLNECLQVLQHARIHADCVTQTIFSLRELEASIFFTRDHDRLDDMCGLLGTSLQLMHANKNNIDSILICLYQIDLMKKVGMIDEAVKLLYFCLETSYQINDELLKADCLVKLYHFIPELEGKSIIENLMIEHYYHTQYTAARRIMLDCFHDLKYVENKYHHDNVTLLFEDLLILSNIINH